MNPTTLLQNDKMELIPVHFGNMLTYVDDTVLRIRLKTKGRFTEGDIIKITNFLKTNFEFTPEIFIDIGANIGTHSIFSIKSGLYKNCLAFEPDPKNFNLLRVNSIINGVDDRINFNRIALSNICGEVEFALSPNNFGDHRVVTEHTKRFSDADETTRVKIEVTTDLLDNVITTPLKRKNTLVWIDIQGHEGHLFKGAEKTFYGEKSPYIVCEFFPRGLKHSGGLRDFFSFLSTRSKIIDLSNPRMGTTITIEELRAISSKNFNVKDWNIDLLLIP